jgi:hypothetical protein
VAADIIHRSFLVLSQLRLISLGERSRARPVRT